MADARIVTKPPRIARVLLDSALPQLDHLFDYAVPEQLQDSIRIGQRIKVPFRSRQRDSLGYVVELVDESSFAGELAQISSLVSPVAMLTPEVWRLARAVADRAGGSAGDILRLAIPPRQVRVEKRHLAQTEPNTIQQTTKPNSSSAVQENEPTVEHLEREVEFSVHTEELLAGARLALAVGHGLVRLSTGEWVGAWAAELARTAVSVYAKKQSVIIIVPDYRDLDQVRDALFALGNTDHVRVDSRQTAGERYANFLRALDPQVRIILGNRSAVYAPAHNLGAVLLWDDGDPVLAEPLTPYVHARDAALVRAEQSGAGLLFAAHSRSAEVQRLTDIGYVQALQMRARRIRVVHSGSLTSAERMPGRIPELATRVLRDGLNHGPVLVQVATPGYAPLVVCARCGDLARCAECAGPISVTQSQGGACRWCGTPAINWHCGSCEGTRFELKGAGSERTAEQFQQIFPETKVILSDGAHPRSNVDARPAVVVATRGAEPIAAGGYQAIILLDIERMLSAETLRAGEDCIRWWENAAALGAPTAKCVVAGGGGPVVQAFVTGNTEVWLRTEMQDRAELRYPPAVRVASVSGSNSAVALALKTLQGLPGIDVLGPTPMPESRVRAIVRFDYGTGTEVANRLRAALLADAATSSAKRRVAAKGRAVRGAPPGALKLRFDDRGAFDDVGE